MEVYDFSQGQVKARLRHLLRPPSLARFDEDRQKCRARLDDTSLCRCTIRGKIVSSIPVEDDVDTFQDLFQKTAAYVANVLDQEGATDSDDSRHHGH